MTSRGRCGVCAVVFVANAGQVCCSRACGGVRARRERRAAHALEIATGGFPIDWDHPFWRHVHPEALSGCWLWHGGVEGEYGRTFRLGKHILAHRFAYRLINGEFPAELDVCHRCDVPACVNPDHLFLGTHADNMRDCAAKCRTRSGRERLTADQVRAIRAEREAGDLLTEIAARYGITSGHVSHIEQRRAWKGLS